MLGLLLGLREKIVEPLGLPLLRVDRPIECVVEPRTLLAVLVQQLVQFDLLFPLARLHHARPAVVRVELELLVAAGTAELVEV